MNLADRQGLGASAQAIELDLSLSDLQMGLVQGLAFAIFYSVLALPIARLAEHVSRTRIISGAVAIFVVMVSACSRANSFWQLLICRIGVGSGDAGFAPPVGSLIGDHYGMTRRASAMSIIWLPQPSARHLPRACERPVVPLNNARPPKCSVHETTFVTHVALPHGVPF